MGKIILEFDIIEDAQDARTALDGWKWKSIIWDLDQLLRSTTKHGVSLLNSKKEYKLKDIKEEIKNWELKAKEDGKDGLILLAGNQLTLGITLPFVDIVFLFNDIVSSDKIIQMMYRCMTESMNRLSQKNFLIPFKK
jgi:hypothetical protein